MPLLLLIVLGFFYAEFRIFLWVAGLIGLGNAFILSIITAVLGIALVRTQGVATLIKAQETIMQKDASHPALGRNFFDGACLALAGFFFIIPGFLTDVLGLALLVPGVRHELYNAVTSKKGVPRAGRSADPSVIEGEYTRLDDRDGGA